MFTRKLFPLGGTVFVALALVAIVGVGGSTPSDSASGAELASFYDAHAVRQGASAFALAVSVPFLLFFGIGLARAIADGEGGSGSAWSDVLVAGTVLAAAGVLLAATAHFALVNAGDNALAPGALQALNALDSNTWMAFNPALGVMLLGAGGALLAAGSLRGLGWAAVVLGLAAFVPFADFFALLLTLVWIVVTGVAVARRGRAVTRVGAARPA
jgi:hypothetical protein